MAKAVVLWVLLLVCLVVVGYTVNLFALNGPRSLNVRLYPWQEGSLPGYWVLAVAVGTGMALVPCLGSLVRTIRRLRVERWKAAAKREERRHT
jgi:hypothetical protein